MSSLHFAVLLKIKVLLLILVPLMLRGSHGLRGLRTLNHLGLLGQRLLILVEEVRVVVSEAPLLLHYQ